MVYWRLHRRGSEKNDVGFSARKCADVQLWFYENLAF